ncbi:hypothetical protein L596_010802 [Steinernema carpocapsae]|uniref:Uncharacterized protein n=1 Tax=Steinernema carpocapsae TaxID=34508 RepID=A0A4U5PJF2_STECR|nr:hypothetical protein L596_010802 [Steinernema carpocapsae]
MVKGISYTGIVFSAPLPSLQRIIDSTLSITEIKTSPLLSFGSHDGWQHRLFFADQQNFAFLLTRPCATSSHGKHDAVNRSYRVDSYNKRFAEAGAKGENTSWEEGTRYENRETVGVCMVLKMSKKRFDESGIRTHASEETGALNQRLRPLHENVWLSYLTE